MDSAEKSLAKRISEIAPTISFSARVDSFGSPGGDKDYMKERHARYKKEIKVIEDQLKNWDAEAVAAQLHKSLKADLAHKKAELLACESEMDMNGVEYDEPEPSDNEEEEIVEEGNPWDIRKRGSKFVVVKSIEPNKGKVMGTHDTKGDAQRQRRALYANIGESPSTKSRHGYK